MFAAAPTVRRLAAASAHPQAHRPLPGHE